MPISPVCMAVGGVSACRFCTGRERIQCSGPTAAPGNRRYPDRLFVSCHERAARGRGWGLSNGKDHLYQAAIEIHGGTPSPTPLSLDAGAMVRPRPHCRFAGWTCQGRERRRRQNASSAAPLLRPAHDRSPEGHLLHCHASARCQQQPGVRRHRRRRGACPAR